MRRSFIDCVTVSLVLALPLVACAAPGEEADESGAAVGWNEPNNPKFVDETFVVELDQLPLQGRAAAALIPGDYWATVNDSVNARWDGQESLSPAEKLEKALNKPGTALRISEKFGIRGQKNRKECTQPADCESLADGSTCGIARGETTGRCIPSWWGICHGWAPYAFSEPPPVNDVTVGDVTFQAGDLEGLMSLAYSDNLPVKSVGERCNSNYASKKNDEVTEAECADLNPGALFVLASNLLGIREQGFVEDRTFDHEVWNHPVQGFRITNAENGKLKEVSKEQANRLLENGITFKPLFAKTTLAKHATKEGSFTVTQEGQHVFKTNGLGDPELFVKIGSPATASDHTCGSRRAGAEEICKVQVAPGDVVHYLVMGYGETQDVEMMVGIPSNDPTYSRSPDADKLFHVRMALSYLTGTPPARTTRATSDSSSSHLETDDYEFILETRAGRVTGGEYIGASKRYHPDFFWWPSGKPHGTIVDGVTYDDIRTIHDRAAGTVPTNARPGREQVILKKFSLGAPFFFPLGLRPGEKVNVSMTGTGQADLYIDLGNRPTPDKHLEKSTLDGADESVTVTAPEGGGSFQVGVYNVAGEAVVSVSARIWQP